MRKNLRIVLLFVVVMMLFASFAQAADVTLRMWAIGGRHQVDLLNSMFDKFYDETGIKVELTMASEWEDLYQKTLVAIAGGNPPDIIRSKDFWVPELASRGVLENLDNWIERDTDISINPNNFWPIRWEQSKYNGQMYSLPWTTFTEMFFYNKQIFDDAGLAGPPDTWAEFREYAKKTTDTSKRQYGSILYTYDRISPAMTEFWEILLMQAGGSVMDEDQTAFTLNTPQGIEALSHQVDMIHEDGTILPPDFSSVTQPVERGQIAMWYSGPWLISSLPKDFPNLDFMPALAPKNENRAMYAVGNQIVMLKGGKHKEETWELLKFMFRKENDYLWNSEGGYLPSRRENINKPPYSTDDKWAVEVEQFKRDDTSSRPYPLGFTEIHSGIAAWLQKAYLGIVSPEEALRKAEEEANAKLLKLSK